MTRRYPNRNPETRKRALADRVQRQIADVPVEFLRHVWYTTAGLLGVETREIPHLDFRPLYRRWKART